MIDSTADRTARDDCESIDDCQLPTDAPRHRFDDGDTVVCPDCGREWEYTNGLFTQTGRRVDPAECDSQ